MNFNTLYKQYMTEAKTLSDTWAKKFNKLADAQRGTPEHLMLKASKVAGSIFWSDLIEHVGDLTHRMAQMPNNYKGGFEYVKPKVKKAMRFLKQPEEDLDAEIMSQLTNNFNYYKKKGDKINYESPEKWLEAVKKAGEDYSKAHASLTVYNDAQKYARDAAVHLGRFEWKKAFENIKKLNDVVEKGETEWKEFALKINNGKEKAKTKDSTPEDLAKMFKL